jgi:hypothetical protein
MLRESKGHKELPKVGEEKYLLTNCTFCVLQRGIDELMNAQYDSLCIVMALMDNTRRDPNIAFKRKDGLIYHSAEGRISSRKVSGLK